MHYGIDIASYQHPNGNPIDYAAVARTLMARSGGERPFVVVKAVEGVNYVNPWFLTDLAGFRANGVDVAAYLFDHGSDSPGAEQQYFRRIAGNIPEAFDIEAPDGLNPQQYGAHLEQLNKLNGTSLDYVNVSEYDAFFKEGDLQNVWLAWPSSASAPARSCVLWQYGQGAVEGIVGQVDLDRWEGTEAQYQTFFHGQPIPPAPVVAPAPAPSVPSPAPRSPAVPSFPLLSQGARGLLVRKVQGLLVAAGESIAIDGDFGPRTAGAVKQFQGNHRLAVDGIVGPLTWAALVAH